MPSFQKSHILEKSILEPEPQPVKAGIDKFGACWAGLSLARSISVEIPSQLHLGGITLCQAHQLWPASTSWVMADSFHLPISAKGKHISNPAISGFSPGDYFTAKNH